MYIAIDGDAVGRKLESYILEENPNGLKKLSQSINKIIMSFQELIEDNQGIIYMCGGDNIIAECSRENSYIVTNFVKEENKNGQIFFSTAMGDTLRDVYLGLNYAKSSQTHYIEVVHKGENVVFLPCKNC